MDACLDLIAHHRLEASKGIVAIAGEAQRLVFQGVHMLFDGQPGDPWGDSEPSCRLVFISRNLDEAALDESFRGCRAA